MAVSAFMTTMDNTVVFTALPTIMADLDMSSSAKDWVATGYILMFSCLMITGGRLSDVFGCRLTFTTGMVVFTAASAVCGLADTSEVLIVSRIVQGAGAALVLPATQVMVTVGRNDKQRSIGNIAFIGAASAATALGPAIGGFIVEHWHWGWIFLINIVPGILVIVLGLFVLTPTGENKHARIDLPGVLISATMLFAFIYGLEAGNKLGWSDPSVLSVFALGAIALVCFIVVENWAPDPMIDLRFFRNRVFTGGLLSQMLYGIGFNGMMFYSQPFLQRFLGFSPSEAGLVMLPPAIAIIVLTPLAFLMSAKIGPRPAIGAGMALMGLGMVLFSMLKVGDGYADLMPGVMLVGVGAALGMPLVMYVLKAVPEKRAGVASGVINVIREASGAFGIAIVGLLVHHVPDEGASAAELETFRAGTSSGLILGAVLVLIGGLISGLTLPSRRGWLGPKHGKTSPVIPDVPDAPGLPGLDPSMTPRDPIPALVAPASGPLAAPVAVAAAAPPNVPLPLPATWEDDPMPDDPVPTPTPGPHWWTDDDSLKPPDDTYSWQDDERPGPPTPWPAPPSEPPPPPSPAPPATPAPPVRANAWEDWPTPESARPTTPIPALAQAPDVTLPDTHQAVPPSTTDLPPPGGGSVPAQPPADTASGGRAPTAASHRSAPPEPSGQGGRAQSGPPRAADTVGERLSEDASVPLGEDGAEPAPAGEEGGVRPPADATAATSITPPLDSLDSDIADSRPEPASAAPELAPVELELAPDDSASRTEAGPPAVLRASWNPADAEHEGGGAVEREVPIAADGERPAPPHGWYEPYVPEEDPGEEPQTVPRGDAW
ncbi:DHA2 family efflux MFS transporter permease subunit [Actinomadura bangladeshensis]|uniref:DHA2 family efflux MFS transporter permease subunit n=1 Tax=Actinomadura bangladeshensis TaxID=453573 RepID=A0A6L9QBX9_9ACTN|nr:DHA2 family efflux MFS transporter permease subunit [Actinomadura bangladeshensis]